MSVSAPASTSVYINVKTMARLFTDGRLCEKYSADELPAVWTFLLTNQNFLCKILCHFTCNTELITNLCASSCLQSVCIMRNKELIKIGINQADR